MTASIRIAWTVRTDGDTGEVSVEIDGFTKEQLGTIVSVAPCAKRRSPRRAI
jgi:hypothetical protein